MRNEIKHVCENVLRVRVCVCARAIITSNLTYPRDDSMGTSDRLKGEFFCLELICCLYFEIKEKHSDGSEK